MHLKSWHFNGGNHVTDKHIGSWKSWSLAVASSVSSSCFIFRISSLWIPVIFNIKDWIQTCHVYHEPHKVCLISSIELSRNQVLQHRRIISTYIRSLWRQSTTTLTRPNRNVFYALMIFHLYVLFEWKLHKRWLNLSNVTRYHFRWLKIRVTYFFSRICLVTSAPGITKLDFSGS